MKQWIKEFFYNREKTNGAWRCVRSGTKAIRTVVSFLFIFGTTLLLSAFVTRITLAVLGAMGKIGADVAAKAMPDSTLGVFLGLEAVLALLAGTLQHNYTRHKKDSISNGEVAAHGEPEPRAEPFKQPV